MTARDHRRDYRIEELAEAAETTVRNVRAYQERGLLPAPRREGRVAFYSNEHLARLRLIGVLLERGYSLGNIQELLETWETGGDLRELLGFEEAITSPFTDELPATVGLPELLEMFGTLDPMAIARAVELHVLKVDGARFAVPSMRLLRVGAELSKIGVPLGAMLEELAALRADVDRIARRFVRLVLTHVFDKTSVFTTGEGPPPKEAQRLAEVVRRLRPLAGVVVEDALALALERHIRDGLGARLDRLLAQKHKNRSPARR